MSSAFHSQQTAIHILENWVFANAGARAAGTGYTITSADIGKIAYQTDTETYWRLTAVGGLAWLQITGLGSAGNPCSYVAENQGGTTLNAGMAVTQYSTGTGVVAANATNNGKHAVGLVTADIAASIAGLIQTDGPLTLADWTAATGSSALSARADYWLDVTNGLLTTTPPSSAGNVVQRIGYAVSAQTLQIEIGIAILL